MVYCPHGAPPAPPKPTGERKDNVTPIFPGATHPLVVRHQTTPEQFRAMVRDLALWMYGLEVEHVTLTREPGTARFNATVDGKPLL